jgi:hypothetical protein
MRFQKSSPHQTIRWNKNTIHQYLKEYSDPLIQSVGNAPDALTQFMVGLEDEYTKHELLALPLTRAHGDFASVNILVENGDISGVTDWEKFTYNDFPMTDLLYFLLLFTLSYAKSPTRKNVPAEKYLELVLVQLKDFGNAWGIPLGIMNAHLSVTLLKHLNYEISVGGYRPAANEVMGIRWLGAPIFDPDKNFFVALAKAIERAPVS